ncbi:MAG: cation:proton antiporter [Bacteroidia bacterium]|nr:cation:proton antiporter [Bacteroidia bacterium]
MAGFIVIAVASNQIAQLFVKIKLPLITGFLVMGILSGPFILDLIPWESTNNLNFVNDISLGFIAFAAGSELYLRELSGRMKSITWMTVGQLGVTFILGSLGVYYLADQFPFMQTMSTASKVSVSILAGTIFVARSPASAIAVINELRAKGPFTQTAIGVTVLKDVLVIILFAINLSIAETLVNGEQFDLFLLLRLLNELILAFLLGYIVGRTLEIVLSIQSHPYLKSVLILTTGYAAFVFAHSLRSISIEYLPYEIHTEPLLICIIGGFVVTNYTRYRPEFLKIVHDIGPLIYVAFFTLIGASMSLDMLMRVWPIALIFFSLRLGCMVIAGVIGGYLGGDPWKLNRIAWMPYVTQAGVGLGLATLVAEEFTLWGQEFATIIIAVIVLNQFVGPPLFKWSINHVGESHVKGSGHELAVHEALIFGLDGESLALARQLKSHSWNVKLVKLGSEANIEEITDIDVKSISEISLEELQNIEAQKSDAIIMMLSDAKNFLICKMAYEEFGTKDLVVRLNERGNFDRFHDLGALIVEPTSAIVSLLDHLVRSPQATSLLLGMHKDQDTIDVEVLNKGLHGIALRDLRLPADIIILSIKRGDEVLISHGYTRLRLHDIVTVVGSIKSIDKVTLLLES